MSENEQTGQGSEKDIPPWLQPVPEDEESSGFFEGRRTLLITAGVALSVVVLFVLVLLYLYDGSTGDTPRHIAADTTPVREKPEDVGGMEVPYQDKQVFDQGATASEQVKLAEQPEEPLETLPEEPEMDEPETGADVAVADQQPAPEVPAAIQAKAQKVVQEQEEPAAEAAQAAATAYKVQLGAYGSEEGAARAWRAAKAKYPAILEGLSPSYEPVQSGNRTLYRLRLGPLESRAAADEVCLGLRAQQQACIVVNP